MSIRMLRLACAVATLAMLPVAAAQAQGPRDQRTYFTFSQSVELPGKTLPAGTYLFRLVDSPGNRHIVQVASEDGKKIQTTLMAIPAQRMDPPEEPEIRFMETSAANPSAIKTWWYPGNTTGHEFIYPREQAQKLAARSKNAVLTTGPGVIWGSGMPKEDSELKRVDEKGTDAAVSETARAEEPKGDVMKGRRVESTADARPAREPRAANDRDRDELPRTARPLPLSLILLLGLGAITASRAVKGRALRFRA